MTHPDRAIEAGARALVRHAWKGSRVVDGEALAASGDFDNKYRDEMKAVLASLAAEGFVVVPKEPTEAMLKAGHAGEYNRPVGRYANIYTAMLAAAQEQNDASK